MAFQADTHHWAYQDGVKTARSNNKIQRGIIAFGLACAATSKDEENARQWLAGFDVTTELMKADVVPEPLKASAYDIWTGEKLDY